METYTPIVAAHPSIPAADSMVRCEPLRASLSLNSCAESFARRQHLACMGCPLGAARLAVVRWSEGQELAPPRNKDTRRRGLASCMGQRCIRCRKQAWRLLYGALCVSCANRAMEVTRGCNAKGRWPARISSQLRHVTADFAAQSISTIIPRARHGPRIEQVAPGRWRLQWLMSSERELGDCIRLLAPSGVLLHAVWEPCIAPAASASANFRDAVTSRAAGVLAA